MKIKILDEEGKLLQEFEGEIQAIGESSGVHYPGFNPANQHSHNVDPCPIVEYRIVKWKEN